MSGLRPELHVAQQIRRDKLRIQNSSQHLQDFPNNITEQVSLHQGPGFSSDLLHVRNVRNGNNMLDDDDDDDKAALYSSEMMISNFSTPSNPLPTAPRNTLECQELGEPSNSSRLMMPHYGSLFPQYSSASTIHSSPKEQCQPRSTNNLGTWRNNTTAPHHQFSDWMLNYPTTTSVVANQTNPNSFLASELLINNNHYNNNVKPSCNLLTDLQSSSPSSTSGGEMATREIQKQLGEMHNTMHYPSSSSAPLYHNALLQDIFKTTSSTGAHVSEMASLMHHGIWGGNNSVPVFHGNQANVCNTPHHQGLSLSLSSNSQSEPSSASHFEERSVNVKPSIVSRDCGKQLHQDSTAIATTPPSNAGYRNVGPLGPFTGYATILKSSRFLKPCQQLLDECCCCQKAPAEWVSRDHHVSGSTSAHDGAVINVDELSGVSAKGVASSSMLYPSKENSSSADGGAATSFCLSSRPECQKNKAKLLYMQEEVTRRYKQYHQQMQMVVSSFESVAGLSSATPYISLALKSVSRHFRCLKNAISDQLKLTYEVLGEDFSIPSTSTSCKIDNNIARLRSMDHSFQKNKSGGSNIDFLEPQLQQVWRPQRGLPERSVAILKAWLFEHFLHPYPTDTDKHMLATQTGLSRNQVSNWFINARVRVWKPMVEEIHMLETKGTTETHQNNSKNEGASPSECSKHARSVDQHVNMFSTHGIAERQFQCLEMGSTSGGNEEKGTNHEEQWNQEKRSKLECEITPNMDGTTVMGFMPYRRGSGLEVGGIGSVSLTLGLRHGVEGVQQHQQQQLQHQEELRRHYGGHMIHDFVG